MKNPNLFSAIVTTFLLFSITISSAQNFSGLKDKKLKKVNDVSFTITDLLSSKVTGAINAITVINDHQDKLQLEIEYTGFENNHITISVKNKAKKEQRFIKKQEFSLKEKISPIEVTLTISEDAPTYAISESAYLEIKIADRKGTFPKIFLYHLNKKWKKKIKPEKITVAAALSPIGSAANLQETDQVLLKPQLKMTSPSAIDGTWINMDKNTEGISKIIISGNGKRIKIYEKGKCTNNNCIHNTILLKENASESYKTKFTHASTIFDLRLNFSNGLEVSEKKIYKKENKTVNTSYTFTKQGSEPEGPDNNPISLWDNLKPDYNFEFPSEISNIRMEIYPDKNPSSGVFYYIPAAYHLRWDTNKGYQFKMLYGTAKDASSGDIRMTGTLTPGIGSTEVALMKTLLKCYISNSSSYNYYKELKIIPLQSNPTISLSSGLQGQYNIPAEKISVGVQSTITEPIDISWITNNRIKEEMQVALSEGVGIQGSMKLVPDSENIPEQLIPVRITLADARTLGRFTLQPNKWRKVKWTNKTPYPLKLRFIHALVIKKEGDQTIPVIYSWSLGDKEVPAGAKASFNTSKMPEWLETAEKTERIWIDYTIVDCESCVNKAMDKLTSGTSGSKIKNITFESFQIFEKLDAAYLKVKIRSRQADPKGNNIVELSEVRIKEDLSTYSAGPLYLPEGENIKYQYFFTLVTNEGVSYHSDNWKSSRELGMSIGVHTLKNNISNLSEIIND